MNNRWNKLFFAYWYVITEIKSWSNILLVGMVKNGCGQSGHVTLKLTDGIKSFFSYWYKFRKAKRWFNYFWVDVVKNIYKSATFSKQVLLRSINFFRRATFWEKASFSEKQYSALPPFSGKRPLYSSYFFKNVTFCSSYLFRRATSSQHFFRRVITSQLRGFSRATLPFIS